MIEERLKSALRELEVGNRGMTWAHSSAAFERAEKRAQAAWKEIEAVRQELEAEGYTMTLSKEGITLCG